MDQLRHIGAATHRQFLHGLRGWWYVTVPCSVLPLGLAALFVGTSLQPGAQSTPVADHPPVPLGPGPFGLLMVFVLSMLLLVAPSIPPRVLGRAGRAPRPQHPLGGTTSAFLASWGIALVLLGLSLPAALSTVWLGGVGAPRVVGMYLVTALLLGVVIAIGLATTVRARTSAAAVGKTHLVLTGLVLGTTVLFLVVTPLTEQTDTYTWLSEDESEQVWRDRPGPIVSRTEETQVVRTDLTWWLLAPNPFVVLIDSAPLLPEVVDARTGYSTDPGREDLIEMLQDELRGAREMTAVSGPTVNDTPVGRGGGGIWPWGLAFDLALAAGALWLATRRLSLPSR